MNPKSGKREKRAKGTKNKNAKEAFLKKIDAAMKIYNYTDENKDVRGKSERLAAINELQNLLQDQR